jgi:hypothetical protein
MLLAYKLSPLSLATCLLLTSACADASPDAEGGTAPLICADCASGEREQSSGILLCADSYEVRDIERDEAESLGFPVTAAAELIETEIDTPIEWVAKDTDGGGPATGYERETRLRGKFHVTSFEYHALKGCDGASCSAAEDGCPGRSLLIKVSGEVETQDGAFSIQFPAQAVNLRSPGETDAVGIAAHADLSEARGRLKLDANVPAPYVGRVDLSVQFADTMRIGYGVLNLSITADADDEPVARGPRLTYQPIEARWGDPPTKGAAMVTPAP